MFRVPSTHRRSFLFLILSQAGLFAANGLTVPLMANHYATLNADPTIIGIIFAVQQFGSLAAPYLWGLRSDRLGQRRPVIFMALAMAGTSMISVAFAHAVWIVIVAQLVFGVAVAGFNAGGLALIGDLIEDSASRGRLLGFVRTTGSLAFALTAVTGGFIADAYGSWLPICIGGVMLLLGCVASFGITERVHSTIAAPPDESGSDTESKTPLAVAVLFFAVVFTWFYGMGSVAWLWPGYMHSIGYPQRTISALWALAAAGEVPGLMLAGYLADRWGRRPLLMAGLIGQGCIYILYQVLAPSWGIVPLQMIRSFSYSSYETPALLVATELGLRQRRGRLAGMYHTIAGLGGVIGSAVSGFVIARSSYALSFTISGIIMITVAVAVASRLPNAHRHAS